MITTLPLLPLLLCAFSGALSGTVAVGAFRRHHRYSYRGVHRLRRDRRGRPMPLRARPQLPPVAPRHLRVAA